MGCFDFLIHHCTVSGLENWNSFFFFQPFWIGFVLAVALVLLLLLLPFVGSHCVLSDCLFTTSITERVFFCVFAPQMYSNSCWFISSPCAYFCFQRRSLLTCCLFFLLSLEWVIWIYFTVEDFVVVHCVCLNQTLDALRQNLVFCIFILRVQSRTCLCRLHCDCAIDC